MEKPHPDSWITVFGKKIQDFTDEELEQVINGNYKKNKQCKK